MRSCLWLLVGLMGVTGVGSHRAIAADPADKPQAVDAVFRRENLVAWCIVPFDDRDRTPEERARSLDRLRIGRLAYDYRANHIPLFDAELEALKRHGIELTAWWFPGALNDEARLILATLKRHGVRTQLWVSGGGAATKTPEEFAARVKAEAERIRPIALAAKDQGCRVSLYNHGGWFGEPEHQVAIIKELGLDNVGIVYNLHHGHAHLDRFSQLLTLMKPHLDCLNLNGMLTDGEAKGFKILPIGEGDRDLDWLAAIRESGYSGPIGILNHTQENAEARLADNLDGLNWLLGHQGKTPPGPKPVWRTYKRGPAGMKAAALDQPAGLRLRPLTVDLSAVLFHTESYNILVASDTKASGRHWELFTEPKSGTLSVYVPGLKPDHLRTQVAICDGQPHTVRLHLDDSRLELLVDGESAGSIETVAGDKPDLPGQLAIGRLAEGSASCAGQVEWVRISQGRLEAPLDPQTVEQPAESTLLFWKATEAEVKAAREALANAEADSAVEAARLANAAPVATGTAPGAPPSAVAASGTGTIAEPAFSADRVAALVQAARRQGRVEVGMSLFAAHTAACLACHQIGEIGGRVGPALTTVGKERTAEEIVEALFWPNRKIADAYQTHMVQTTDGKLLQLYKVGISAESVEYREPRAGTQILLRPEEIEETAPAGSLMPVGLIDAWSAGDQSDLVRFLMALGTSDGPSTQVLTATLSRAHVPVAATFPVAKAPLHPGRWRNASHPVNRDRIYDFYAKQADFFRVNHDHAPLLAPFPGLDGGTLGHWGNQNDDVWKDGRWQESDMGSLQCTVIRGERTSITRGICIQVDPVAETVAKTSVADPATTETAANEPAKTEPAKTEPPKAEPAETEPKAVEPAVPLNIALDPMNGQYRLAWSGKLLEVSDHRHGLIGAPRPGGPALEAVTVAALPEGAVYRGFYRNGRRVVPAFQSADVEWIDTAEVVAGRVEITRQPRGEHPHKAWAEPGSPQWPDVIETPITPGSEAPYALDTIALPQENPWKAPVFCAGHAFGADGAAYVVMAHGDVWRVTEFAFPSTTAKWKRFASGLHQPLGVWSDASGLYVLCRDQITRLHDLNGDHEADFYECFSQAFFVSPGGHDYNTGLERDAQGRFYFASGYEGLVRVSADGSTARVVATGFRNPDGVGLYPDGAVTVPCSEGDWTPASTICLVRPDEADIPRSRVPHFGYEGPRHTETPALPLVYLPRGLDNSAGGQVWAATDTWGPLSQRMIHLSWGTGTHHLLLRDEVNGQAQGAIVPLPGDFQSGAHRGRFCPQDGQLYVSGCQGWGSYTPDDGCFQRVRYTGGRLQVPVGWRAHQNGIVVEFLEPLDPEAAACPAFHFAQVWNYRYSRAYGSPELSTRHRGVSGHDHLNVTAAHVLPGGKSLFLEIPDLQPVSQLHLRLLSGTDDACDLFATVHALDVPFTGFEGYAPIVKTIGQPPLWGDVALATKVVKNPHIRPISGARAVTLETGLNLSFTQRELTFTAGEAVLFTLKNVDSVPHNFVLVKPGELGTIAAASQRLIADPDAWIRHYVPTHPSVLAYTDVVDPGQSFAIYFRVPKEPGRYPYLCTFPGHSLVMNGTLTVAPATEQPVSETKPQ
jgi:putative heme-binding domain-containing protein